MFFRNRFLEASLKLEQELRSRILEKDTIIAVQFDEITRLRSKVERMEIVLMPLSSAPGATFVAMNQPKREVPKAPPLPADSSWQRYLNNYIAEQDQLEKENSSV